MKADLHWILIENWDSVHVHLEKMVPLSFLLPSSVLGRLGAPIIRIYQDFLAAYPTVSLTVECQTVGQALTCIYHGIDRIFYPRTKSLLALKSLSSKNGCQLITNFPITSWYD